MAEGWNRFDSFERISEIGPIGTVDQMLQAPKKGLDSVQFQLQGSNAHRTTNTTFLKDKAQFR